MQEEPYGNYKVGMAATSESILPGAQLIKQGAEARIYKSDFFGKPAIAKERFVKSYRVAMLDQKLSQRRMSQEARSMARCRRHGIRAPAVYHLDFQKRVIFMEEVTEGILLKDYIIGLDVEGDRETLTALVRLIGAVLAQMHDIDVVHGDLTTSNMIYDPNLRSLTLIDFGLSYVSGLAEDKGVDLYVLERAFLSTHPNTEQLFRTLLDSYSASSKNSEAVIAKLDEVRMRGRKRTMVG